MLTALKIGCRGIHLRSKKKKCRKKDRGTPVETLSIPQSHTLWIIVRGSFKNDSKFQVKHKNNLCFFLKLCFVLLTLEVLVIHENAITFFSKIMFLSYHPQLHQIFATLPLTSIHQPP